MHLSGASVYLHHLGVGQDREQRCPAEHVAYQNGDDEAKQGLREVLLAGEKEHERFHAAGDNVLGAADRDEICEHDGHLKLRPLPRLA